MIGAYAKAVAGTVRALPLLGRPDELPEDEVVREGIAIDREHLSRYDRVCGFRLRDEAPPTYPHLLAFPLSMELMTRFSFPFGVIGLVHVENLIEQRRALRAGDRVDVRVGSADLREHDRGRQFDVVATVAAGGEDVWTSRSTYLHREGGGGGNGASKGRGQDGADPPAAAAVWSLPGDVGRRYAAVSGDRNPIHMHPLAAKAFGMPGMIAHGMWLKARCLAALDARLGDSVSARVRFKLPVVLPAKVAFSSTDGSFALHDARNGRPHVDGSFESPSS